MLQTLGDVFSFLLSVEKLASETDTVEPRKRRRVASLSSVTSADIVQEELRAKIPSVKSQGAPETAWKGSGHTVALQRERRETPFPEFGEHGCAGQKRSY